MDGLRMKIVPVDDPPQAGSPDCSGKPTLRNEGALGTKSGKLAEESTGDALLIKFRYIGFYFVEPMFFVVVNEHHRVEHDVFAGNAGLHQAVSHGV
jgi:hypothetical protein